jgi:hypothetical protein
MAVPMASPHTRPAACAGLGKPRPFIPVSPKHGVEFRFQEFLDEAANAGPHPSFQGIEPIVPNEKRSFGRFRRRVCGIRFHGVISIGALTPIRFVETTRRLRHLQIPTTPATAPVLEKKDGSRTFVNIEIPDDLNMVDLGYVTQGLQTLIREGRYIHGGVRACGAAGRVLTLESVK